MAKIKPFSGKPHKERLLATLRGEKTDRVPHFESLIEDQHVEKLLGRKAGNTLAIGGDPAKGSAAAEGGRPMHPEDYIELCEIIGQEAIAFKTFWTPIRAMKPDGKVGFLNDRSVKGRDDLDRIIWPDEDEIEDQMKYVSLSPCAGQNPA